MIKDFQKLDKEKGRPLLVALGDELVRCRLVPNGDETVGVAQVVPVVLLLPATAGPVEEGNATGVVVLLRHLFHQGFRLVEGHRPVSPPLHQHRDALGGDGNRQTEEVALRAIGLLAQQLAAQERLEHPQKITDRVELGHDNLQFDWFRFSIRDSTALATISKKIADIVLEIVANSQQTRYQGTTQCSVLSIAYCTISVKSCAAWVKKWPILCPFLRVFRIKNFSSPQFKTWFGPMFFPGSFAVFCGAASPPAFLAGVVPRRRRGGFGLIQVSCTRKEIASQSSPPRVARRLARIVFSAQNGIRDFV